MDTNSMVPVGDPDNWTLVEQLFSTAIVMDGWVARRVAIHELREAGIWKSDWDKIPDFPEESDEQGIVANEDRTT